MKTMDCLTEKVFYQPPLVEVIEIVTSQMVCGSNEDIVPGEPTDW